ncbi:hypothetical protein [Streptomyces sp. NPDC001833]
MIEKLGFEVDDALLGEPQVGAAAMSVMAAVILRRLPQITAAVWRST